MLNWWFSAFCTSVYIQMYTYQMVVWVSAINSVNTSLPMPYQSQTFICFLFGTSVITSLSGRRVFGCVFWRFIRIRKSRYWWFSVWSLLNTTGYTSCIFFTRFCYNKNTSYIHQFDCDCFFSIFSKYKVCFFFVFQRLKLSPPPRYQSYVHTTHAS